jgi:hypothetical protein
MKKLILISAAIGAILLSSCRKDETPEPEGPKIRFRFEFDSTQVRLDNFGQPASIPSGHAAQSPVFNKMSAHYIEFAPGALTQLGNGAVAYHAPETTAGGSTAIDFAQSTAVGAGVDFFSMPIKDLAPGTYNYLRVSLAYQNYDIKFRYNGTLHLIGTVASFIGYNTFIQNLLIKTQTIPVNANKTQGFWAFEWMVGTTPFTTSGQAPAGSTTVVNPIASTSPIPAGSCVVTAQFSTPFTITGNETSDIIITVSLSTNKSFEWQDAGADGFYDPADGDQVVDMGVRGMVISVQR